MQEIQPIRTDKAHTVIMGAGPAGLSAAWKLTSAGNTKVSLLELEATPGGLCRTIKYKNFFFDLGGHRFITRDDEVLNEIKNLMGSRLLTRPRKSVVRLMGKYYYYPLGGKDLLLKMNPITSIRCFLDYLYVTAKNHLSAKEEISFEDWVVNRFGRSLYDIYFGPYTEKLWGIEPTNISASWAAQRVTLLNLWDVFLRLLGKQSNTPKTYALDFYYPEKGIGQIFDVMLEQVLAKGGTAHFNSRVNKVFAKKGVVQEVNYIKDNKEGQMVGNFFISTIPLPELVKSIEPPVPQKYLDVANQMHFRSIRFLNLIVQGEQITNNTWIYIPEKKYLFFRIQEPKNWSPLSAPDGKTSLILEIACNVGDDIWNAKDKEIFDRCIQDLEALNLIKRDRVLDYFSTWARHAYPVYDLDYIEKTRVILELLSQYENLLPIGRQGLFRYNNMDHSIKMGLLAAKYLSGDGVTKEDILKIATEEKSFELER